jgi:hypothetical protein
MPTTPPDGPETWRRSSRCESATCVEVAVLTDRVLVRHSSHPHTVLEFSRPEWAAFLAGIGEFELPAP